MADYSVTSANVEVRSGATVSSGTAGEALTPGEALYLKASDGKLYKADNAASASAECVGIAVTEAAASNICYYVSAGPMDIGAATAVGDTIIVSATAGGLGVETELAADDYYTVIGHTIDASGGVYVNIYASGAVHA